MYAVIFTAELGSIDDDYLAMVKKMRSRAFEQYNCVGMNSVVEGNKEITISYWPSLDDISHWKQDSEHLTAQALGKQKWYRTYDVKVVEVLREYQGEL